MSLFVAFGFVFESKQETLLLFDDELIVLDSLVSFPGKVWQHCRPKISFHVSSRSSYCGLKLDMDVFCARVSFFVGY
jgi:hypothetical protein